MDSLKFHSGQPCFFIAVSGVARLQGRQPVAIFYSLEHPMLCVYELIHARALWSIQGVHCGSLGPLHTQLIYASQADNPKPA
jgi:hypothetical protein